MCAGVQLHSFQIVNVFFLFITCLSMVTICLLQTDFSVIAREAEVVLA